MNTPFIIAEVGVNHDGDAAKALQMIEAAASAGANCVKFQAFEPEALVARATRPAEYQSRNTGAGDQLEMIRSLALDFHDFELLSKRCASVGVEFLATAFDTNMLGDLLAMGMRRLKIASGELTNEPALRKCAQFDVPILLSTGMATDAEVDRAIGLLRSERAKDVTILQCTTAYPAPIEMANLRAMVAMGARHGMDFGYSDHTLGDSASIAATALGASVIEKHFTLDRTAAGPDHNASMEPDDFAQMIRKIREVAAALGSAIKTPSFEEIHTAQLVRRSWHAARPLVANQIISEGDVLLLRPASGLPPSENIFGARVACDIAAGSAIAARDLKR